ncbi:hypothetical protein [Georgenia alba]|uniref:Uncharacterized protein n=1 Tax=Georgenia alba TaxID=2233858 RepID=A0ABW2QB39_9MICO
MTRDRWCTVAHLGNGPTVPHAVAAMPQVRPLASSDLGWVVGLAAARRERLAGYAPRFWRPAPDARERHAPFLAGQIDDPGTVTVRTDRGYLLGAPQGDRLVADDMVLEDDSAWGSDGVALLLAAGRHADLRAVCPVPERARRETVEALGLTRVESWWTRDLPTSESSRSDGGRLAVESDGGRLTVDGGAGRLVTAPPVYAPGGPVLLVTEVTGLAPLLALEQAARQVGAVVSVVAVPAGDATGRDLLEDAGYRATTDYHEGRPRGA